VSRAHGILLQFGGQTAINLGIAVQREPSASQTKGLDLSIMGTSCDAVDEASDRERFEAFAKR